MHIVRLRQGDATKRRARQTVLALKDGPVSMSSAESSCQKLLSVIELVKHELAKEGHKWYQYNRISAGSSEHAKDTEPGITTKKIAPLMTIELSLTPVAHSEDGWSSQESEGSTSKA